LGAKREGTSFLSLKFWYRGGRTIKEAAYNRAMRAPISRGTQKSLCPIVWAVITCVTYHRLVDTLRSTTLTHKSGYLADWVRRAVHRWEGGGIVWTCQKGASHQLGSPRNGFAANLQKNPFRHPVRLHSLAFWSGTGKASLAA